ncbi:putative DNA-directed RNA polymerase II subunit RPB2, partial [Aureobasidium melanogenum]
MGNGHTRRNGVRVDDDVRNKSIGGEGHILLTVGNTDGTLLTVTRGKLVTNLRNLRCARTNLDELETLDVGCKKHLIDETTLGGTQRRAMGAVLPMMISSPETRVPGAMIPSSSSLSYVPCFILMVSPRVGFSNCSTTDMPTRFSWSIDNGVLSGRQFSELKVFHRSCGTKRLLRIVEDVGHGIHAHIGNNRGANTENHGRVNFAVSPDPDVRVGLALDSSVRLLLPQHPNCTITLLFAQTNSLGLSCVEQVVNVLSAENELALCWACRVIINDKQWSHDTTSISENLEFALTDISDERDFKGDGAVTTKTLHNLDKLRGISVDTDPHAVHEDLGGIRVVLGLILLKQLHISLVHELNDGLSRSTNTDGSQQGRQDPRVFVRRKCDSVEAYQWPNNNADLM